MSQFRTNRERGQAAMESFDAAISLLREIMNNPDSQSVSSDYQAQSKAQEGLARQQIVTIALELNAKRENLKKQLKLAGYYSGN